MSGNNNRQGRGDLPALDAADDRALRAVHTLRCVITGQDMQLRRLMSSLYRVASAISNDLERRRATDAAAAELEAACTDIRDVLRRACVEAEAAIGHADAALAAVGELGVRE